jgi:short-subunit dehydrogenase
MRNMSNSNGLIKIASEENLQLNVAQLDVNDDLSVNKAIDKIVKDNDRIDILVNNAGYDLFGPLEESSLEEIKQQFETNVFGVIRTTKAVIPTMRKQGKGTIINLSSVGGKVGLLPFLTAYHASKFAIEGFTESLRQELDDFNINIILIEPGYVSSSFLDNSKYARGFDANKSPYAKKVQQIFQDVLNSPNPELRNPVGKDADSIFKARAELSDKEMEQWSRETYIDKKGFIRQ